MVKFECPLCGYSMQTAQYLNGKGHCLKCDGIVAHTDKHPLNPEWTKKMRIQFDKLNADGVVNKNGLGTLDLAEMTGLLKKGHAGMTDEECQMLFEGADTNGNGVLEFTEFLWFIFGTGGSQGAAGAAPKAKAKSKAGGGSHSGGTGPGGLAPSDACESDSGVCSANDGGPHHFKFGQCQFCKKGEGQLSTGGPGAMANPGGGGGGCPKGGKCMFKFSKCKKCGAHE